jgi:hypothetical protein
MSRAATGDTVVVKPTNNIYTALLAAALVAQIVGLVVLFLRAQTLFEKGLL